METRRLTRTYRDGDEEGIFELFQAVYPSEHNNRDRWMRWWNWLYRENPAGPAKIYVVEEQGKIIAHFSYILIDLNVGNEIIKSGLNIFFMSHPESTYRGLFLLERRVLREAEREGVYIIFGFPTEAVRPGHMRVGYFEIAHMRPMVKLLNLENVFRTRVHNTVLTKLCTAASSPLLKTIYRSRKSPAVKDLIITQVASFDDRVTDLWASVCDSHQIMVIRKKQYLNWRYSPPDIDYTIYIAEKGGEILGYIIIRFAQWEDIKQARIYDIIGRSEDVLHCLVSKAVEHARKAEADYIYCNMLANSTYLKALRRNGFISTPFTKRAWFGAYSSAPSIPKAFLEDYRNWFISLGDTDTL